MEDRTVQSMADSDDRLADEVLNREPILGRFTSTCMTCVRKGSWQIEAPEIDGTHD